MHNYYIFEQTKNYGVKVILALPPDTDTPGFANENKSKPLETLLISETTKLFTPEEVGKKILQDALVITNFKINIIFMVVYAFKYFNYYIYYLGWKIL